MLLVDKPAGMTSHDAVLAARGRASLVRVGHTGTLDPFATGLLLLLAGPFTRAMQYFHGLAKRYSAVMHLGVETDTEDRTGTAIAESGAWRELSEDEVLGALATRVGEGTQVPPSYSAKKIDGRRAYAEARRGAIVELAPVPVTVHRIELERFDPPEVTFSATVSTGTYVRSLARDIGRDLGCGAHLVELRRTGIGPFAVEDAVAPDDIAPPGSSDTRGWLTPAEALSWLPLRWLEPGEASAVGHGRAIPLDGLEGPPCEAGPIGPPGEDVVALVADGQLVAIAERIGDELRPRTVFAT